MHNSMAPDTHLAAQIARGFGVRIKRLAGRIHCQHNSVQRPSLDSVCLVLRQRVENATRGRTRVRRGITPQCSVTYPTVLCKCLLASMPPT